MRKLIMLATVAGVAFAAPVSHAAAPVEADGLPPLCHVLMTHRAGLSEAQITSIQDNALRIGMSPDELLYWQTQARAKGMNPEDWDAIKTASKLTHAANPGLPGPDCSHP
jgi:hypothetical protein